MSRTYIADEIIEIDEMTDAVDDEVKVNQPFRPAAVKEIKNNMQESVRFNSTTSQLTHIVNCELQKFAHTGNSIDNENSQILTSTLNTNLLEQMQKLII